MISKKLLSIVMAGLLAVLLNACSGTGETSNNTDPADNTNSNADVVAPSKPTNLHTSSLLPTSVVLAWDACTDNMQVAGYRVYKNNVMVGTVTTTSYTDNSLTSNTAYQYAVVAYDSSGNETMSDALSVTTPVVADTTAPIAPGNLRTTSVTSNSISLAWNASTDNVGVTGYRLYRGTSLLVTTTSLTYVNSELTPNTSYQYHVDAVDAAGNIASSSTLTVSTSTDTTAPTAPGNLRSTTTTSSSAGLAWNASTDNVGVAYYRVYRNSVQISQTTSTTYTDNTVAASTSYSYSVRAYDVAGNYATSSTLQVNTPAVSNSGTATLSWTPPTQNSDNSALTNLSRYVVYYGTSQSNLNSTLQVNSGLSSVVVENLQSGVTYYFAITSVNSLGVESDLSNIVSKTTS
jgi:chitodextrinase